MKNNIKKFLICAFVSAVGVVSLMGDIELSQQKEVVAQTELNNLEAWEKINNTAGASVDMVYVADVADIVDVIENDNAIVSSPTLEFTDGWTTGSVNVRKEPNTESEVLTVYSINTYVSHHKGEDGWSIIEYNGDYAYINSEYISDTEVPKEQYTEDELYMLSHLIMGEAGGQSDTCQLYVGSVVLNRIKSNKFPNTMKEVIFQKGQYACTWDGNYDKIPTERCIKNAKYLLEYGSVLPDNVIWQARRAQGKGVYDIVDGEYFCY